MAIKIRTDKMQKPCYIYHPEHKPRIVDEAVEDMDALAAAGWVDTPAKFEDESEEDDNQPTNLPGLLDQLVKRFSDDPDSLTDKEIMQLGDYFNANTKATCKRETNIKRLKEHIINVDD